MVKNTREREVYAKMLNLFSKKLRKLALQRCELELLRSHPKDERGSVREIGLWSRMFPTPLFLELSRTVC